MSRGRGWRRVTRWLAAASLLLALLAVVSFFTWIPRTVDERLNGIVPGALPEVTETARRLHASLQIADLHADPLVWDRDLLERGSRGHVDVPRLLEGNVALQTFSAVTYAPAAPDYQTGWDRCTALAIAQGWPRRTWRSPFERALYQAEKLRRFVEASGGSLVLVQSRAELRRHLERRSAGRPVTAGLLSIEGAHAIEGKLDNVDALFAAGFRMIGLAHFHDNAVAGSAHGAERSGLSELGRRAVARMEALGIVVDLAHAAPRTIDETLDLVRHPVVVSHTGVQATCPGPRNVSDRHIRRIAENGGVIGIGFFEWAVCGTAPERIVGAVRHVAELVGVDHVGLGSDFDGAVRTAFDVTGLPRLTQALVAAGFTEEQIRKIMGENVLRVLRATLPPRAGKTRSSGRSRSRGAGRERKQV